MRISRSRKKTTDKHNIFSLFLSSDLFSISLSPLRCLSLLHLPLQRHVLALPHLFQALLHSLAVTVLGIPLRRRLESGGGLGVQPQLLQAQGSCGIESGFFRLQLQQVKRVEIYMASIAFEILVGVSERDVMKGIIAALATGCRSPPLLSRNSLPQT